MNQRKKIECKDWIDKPDRGILGAERSNISAASGRWLAELDIKLGGAAVVGVLHGDFGL